MTNPNDLEREADEFLRRNDPEAHIGKPLDRFAQEEFEKQIKPRDTDRIDLKGRPVGEFVEDPEYFIIEPSDALSAYQEPLPEPVEQVQRPKTAKFRMVRGILRRLTTGVYNRALKDDALSGEDYL